MALYNKKINYQLFQQELIDFIDDVLYIGWHGNMEKANQGMTMPPSMPGGMTR